MSYKNTFEAILNDINEAKQLVERFKNLESIPSIEMDIALSKFRSIYELLLMLQQEKDVPTEWPHSQEPVTTQADYSEKHTQGSGFPKNAPAESTGMDSKEAHNEPGEASVVKEGDMPGREKETGKSMVQKEEIHVMDSTRESEDRKRETHVEENVSEDTGRKQELNVEGDTAGSFVQEEESDAAKKPESGDQSPGQRKETATGKERQEEKKEILADKFQQTEARNESMAKSTGDISQKLQKRPISDIKKAIGINDKFYFIKELFHGSSKQYELTINDLNDKASYEHALSYLNENFDWNFDEDPASRFLAIIQRKFPE